jgi:hypothetical protein
MNQVIRIIFDDPVDRGYADIIAAKLQEWVGDVSAIEVYEEEFEENENGQEQRQGNE